MHLALYSTFLIVDLMFLGSVFYVLESRCNASGGASYVHENIFCFWRCIFTCICGLVVSRGEFARFGVYLCI